MTDVAEASPGDGAYISIARDGDVLIVTGMLGLVRGESVDVSATDGRLKVGQGGRTFLDVPLDDKLADEVMSGGAVKVLESGAEDDDSEFVVHGNVRRKP